MQRHLFDDLPTPAGSCQLPLATRAMVLPSLQHTTDTRACLAAHIAVAG